MEPSRLFQVFLFRLERVRRLSPATKPELISTWLIPLQDLAYGFQISGGALAPLSGSPFPTGSQPTAIAVDASSKYALIANGQDSNLAVYSINSGSLSKLGTYTTGGQPVAIGIDPSLNEYVYTANFLGNSVSGFQLNLSDGSLLNSQFSPSASNANPTAVAAVTHNQPKK